MPSKFNNFPSPEQVYTGSDTDIQREKRMNNWVRSNSLPSMIGDAVQSAMLNNPYDRSAALRAELAQHTANSMNLPWRTKEALATELFKQSPIDATSGDGAAPGRRLPYNPVAATQSAGPVASRGVINGKEIAVPTAGNYLNGAFSQRVNDLGLAGDAPAWSDFQSAEYNQTTPAQRLQISENEKNRQQQLDVANINAQGRVNAASMKGSRGSGKDDPLKAQQRLYGGDDKQRQAYTKELYGEYKNFVKANGADVPFEAWTLSDPIARAITSKYQDLGQQSGRSGRESRQAKADLMTGNMTPGAQAEKLAQTTLDNPRMQQKIAQNIAQARAQGAAQGLSPEQTDEAIWQAAQQSGLNDSELAAVRQGLGGKILKAQYGNPGVHPAKKKSMNGQAPSNDVSANLLRAGAGAAMRPDSAENYRQGRAGYANFHGAHDPVLVDAQGNVIDPRYQPAGTTRDMYQPSGTTKGQDMQYAPPLSLLDELIRRIQQPSNPYPNPFMPVRRYGGGSPIA